LDTAEFGAEDEKPQMVGILTLENIIERVLQTDIHDEKDYERFLGLGRQPSVMYRSQSDFNASYISD
jgi:hypothetical protein